MCVCWSEREEEIDAESGDCSRFRIVSCFRCCSTCHAQPACLAFYLFRLCLARLSSCALPLTTSACLLARLLFHKLGHAETAVMYCRRRDREETKKLLR